jgi:hypothetical protein
MNPVQASMRENTRIRNTSYNNFHWYRLFTRICSLSNTDGHPSILALWNQWLDHMIHAAPATMQEDIVVIVCTSLDLKHTSYPDKCALGFNKIASAHYVIDTFKYVIDILAYHARKSGCPFSQNHFSWIPTTLLTAVSVFSNDRIIFGLSQHAMRHP